VGREREKITEAKNSKERKNVHEFNCRSCKGATLFSPFFLSPEGERLNRMCIYIFRCAETKKKYVGEDCSLSSSSSSWWLYICAQQATTIEFDKRRTWCDCRMKEKEREKRKKERERRITLLPTFGLNRDERTEGRLEINIIKFSIRCVTIAQSFFYSFSHHFVNVFFLFCFLFYKQQQQQQSTKRFACSVRSTRIRRNFFTSISFFHSLSLPVSFSFSHPCDEQHFITRMYTYN
jgi:hypothetical protein